MRSKHARSNRSTPLRIALAAVLVSTVPAAAAFARPHRTTQPTGASPTSTAAAGTGLSDPRLKEIAQQLVSSAENSSLDWKAQVPYIEDIKDGRGYTAGIVGFCSGTGDMYDLLKHYQQLKPDNTLARYLPALSKLNGSSSHSGLDPDFVSDWKKAATDPTFQKAQEDERDRVYFGPAVMQAQGDGLRALGQFIYYDAIVMHGPGDDSTSFGGIRASAMKKARTPAQGGDEKAYLTAFLDARRAAMKTEAAHEETDRVDTEQLVFLKAGNLDLQPPLVWKVYGESFHIDQ
ncbi:chitosanase [Kitasatospora sp. NPDC049258]|uniref:chitosanase n=1 Tax=Kitasatospora sp. NPDC049258 TaxID=3155394 RepID=UPI00343EBF3B